MCVFVGCGERKSVFPSPDQGDAIWFSLIWEARYFISNQCVFVGSALFLEVKGLCLKTEIDSSNLVKER